MKNFKNVLLAVGMIGLLVTYGCNLDFGTDGESEKAANSEPAETEKSKSDPQEQPENVAKETASEDAPAAKPEPRGKDEKEFIPEGWKQEDRITGDLNGDSRPDTVLQIVKKDTTTDFNRRMIVLLQTSDGKYTLGGEGRKVIRCTECHGTFGPGPADIKIQNGVIIVSQLYGSRWATDYLHRFRYEKATGKFLMIGEDVKNFDRGLGESETTSTNYLTGKQIVIKEKVRGDGDYEEVSRNERSVARTKKYLEDINYEDY